jgi:hypothetical protein
MTDPTAVHASGAVHETALNALKVVPGGSRVGTMDQRTPFQCSASVSSTGLPPYPTATHDRRVGQDTLATVAPGEGGPGVGDGTIVHRLPSHRSASVTLLKSAA